MNTVNANHMRPTITTPIHPITPPQPSAIPIVISHNTSDSCACASDNAHRRRYDAVCEMQPRQYSMVWMTWCTMTSLKSCVSCNQMGDRRYENPRNEINLI